MSGRPQPAQARINLVDLSKDMAADYYITADNWYCGSTINAYLESVFKEPIEGEDPNSNQNCKFEVEPAGIISQLLIEKKQIDAKQPKDAKADEDWNQRAQTKFTELYNRVQNGENLIIPINVGEHWVLSIMKKGRDGAVRVYYFDPLGHSMSDTLKQLFENVKPPAEGLRNVGEFLTGATPNARWEPQIAFVQSAVCVQDEDPKVHCGPYVLVAAEVFAKKLVGRDLDEGELNAELQSWVRNLDFSPNELRLKHAEKLYELAKKDKSMQLESAVIQRFSSEQFERFKDLLKTGQKDPCLKYLQNNQDWLPCKKKADGSENQHCDQGGVLLVTETKLDSGKKIFKIHDQGDYVIRLPRLDGQNRPYLLRGEVQYDVLVFEKGKLLSCIVPQADANLGSYSQICPTWLDFQLQKKAPGFIDFQAKAQEAGVPNSSQTPSDPRAAAERSTSATPTPPDIGSGRAGSNSGHLIPLPAPTSDVSLPALTPTSPPTLSRGLTERGEGDISTPAPRRPMESSGAGFSVRETSSLSHLARQRSSSLPF